MIRPFAALSLAVMLASAAPAAAFQSTSDPFAPGQRWSVGPGSGGTWIPRDVVFAAGGELVWAAPAVGNPRLALYAAGATQGGEAPLFEGPPLPGAIGIVPVAAGAGPSDLFAAPQFADPDLSNRRTEVVRYDALAAGAGAPFEPSWTRVLPVQGNGPSLLAADASGGLVAAIHDPSGEAYVEWLSPATGLVLADARGAGGSLGALAMAEAGSRVALTAGVDLWVFDSAGQTVHHETLPAATGCLALSGAGDVLVVGGFDGARVLVDDGAGFAEAFLVPAGPKEMAATAALSADGSTVCVGFWDFISGTAVRVESRDVAGGALLHGLAWSGPGGLQNFPQEISLTADGGRIAVGLWGQGGAEPEVVLLDRAAPQPIQAWSLSGSVLALDLDPSGTRIATAVKDSHANQFATTGTVRVHDTGERDVQVVGPAQIGGTLEVAFLQPGMSQAIFALGTPSPGPRLIPGVQGALLLNPGLPLLFAPAPATAEGRADLVAPLAPDPVLVGSPIGLQAVGLGAEVVFSHQSVKPQIL
ncbi:MAG: hypothetical protein AAF682_15285 [Planctomycetota bacterium]